MHRHLYTRTLILGMSVLAPPSLEARCTVRAQRVTFGQYDVFSAQPLTSTGRIVYRCQRKDRSIRIELDRGAGSTYADRHMARGTEKLNYNLYLDAGATQVWGNGLENTQVYFQLNPGTGVRVPVFAVVPARQDVTARRYRDRVTVLVLF